MKSAGLTQTAIARACCVTQGSVSGWKNGALPSADKLPSLAVCLGVSMSWLLTGEEETPTPPKSPAPAKSPKPRVSFWQRSFLRSRAIALEARERGDISGARYWARYARADFAAWKGGDPAPKR
jgi:transcriptional regulator with XRE-family HTH domain